MPSTPATWFLDHNVVEWRIPPPDDPPDPPDPPVTGSVDDTFGFKWVIHPKRRSNAISDRRLKRRPFTRVSDNDDFRAWRRVVTYVGRKVRDLFTGRTYGEWKATGKTYGELKATGKTYGELKSG